MAFNVISPDDIARGLIDGLLPVYKQWAETPLQTLDRIRVALPALQDVPLSYAGRLDPLAEGLMLVLCGEANKARLEYLGLDKEYEFEVLFGLSTDTGDLLGLPITIHPKHADSQDQHTPTTHIEEAQLVDAVNSLTGQHTFPYPVFSSKTVQGKPLFEWYKEGRIDEIKIPDISITIRDIEVLSLTTVTAADVYNKVSEATRLVSGDFRQKDILSGFDKLSINESSRKIQVARIRAHCTSGTYIRTLAQKIGELCHTNALAYSIKRTKVGDISIKDIKIK